MLQVLRILKTVRFVPWGAAVALACFSGCSDEDDGDGDGNAAGGGVGGISFAGSSGNAGNAGNAGTTGGTGPTMTPMCETLEGLGQCGSMMVEATFKTVNILIVLDKSGSMEDTPEGFDQTKWDSMKLALDAALTNVQNEINFGLLLYPNSVAQQIPLDCVDNCCEVPAGLDAVSVSIGPGAETVPQISQALGVVGPGGGTPTAVALERARQYFTEGDGATLEGERYVLLATDGGPNCNENISCDADSCTENLDGRCGAGNCCSQVPTACVDDAAVNDAIAGLAADGIPTFVVGIPGTEAYSSFLDTFAETGGVPAANGPPHYYAVSAMGGVQELTDVFSTITTQLVRSCDIVLSSDPPRLDQVNVAVDCEVVLPEEPDGSGWMIDDSASPNTLHLLGGLCEQVQQTGAQRVDVVYGCPTIR